MRLRRSWANVGVACSRPAKRRRRSVAAAWQSGKQPGIARSTIDRGLCDLRATGGRVRRPGGGGKSATEAQPGLLDALNQLVQSSIPRRSRGCPGVGQQEPAPSGCGAGRRCFTSGQKLVGRLLRRLGCNLLANSKTREGANHPDRNAQFEHINAEALAVLGDCRASGSPWKPRGWSSPASPPALSRQTATSCSGIGPQIRRTWSG